MNFAINKITLGRESVPCVDIDIMNTTHYEELEIVNVIGRLIDKMYPKDNYSLREIAELSVKLDDWLEHTKAHFSRENRLMEESGFPAYSIHSDEHKIALNKIETVISAWNTNQDLVLVSDYIFVLWPAWFVGHVKSMDMMTSTFLKMKGYS